MRFLKRSQALLVLLMFGAGTASAVTLKEVQSELAKKGASWKAGKTSAADMYGSDVFFGLAEAPKISKEDAAFDQRKTSKALPSHIDWRDKDGADWMSPIRNQGRCGSCVAFASLAMLEARFNIAAGHPGYNPNFSEQYHFSKIGSCDWGSQLGSAMSSLRSTGVPDEACQPYVSGRTGADQGSSAACSERSSRSIKITDYTSLSASQIKQALQDGPVMTSMTVYEDFMFYTGGIYRYTTGSVAGGHAITIVGYDDAEGYFIVKNSWGTDWGEHGYFRIAYNDRSGLGRSGYALTVAGPSDLLKTTTPDSFQAVSGNVVVQVSDLTSSTSLGYRIKNGASSADQRTGTLNPSSRDARVAVDDLTDGVYELRVDNGSGDMQTGPAWYNRMIIANNRPSINVVLEPDFDASQDVSGRVYFNLKADGGAVPLTGATIHIKSSDGSVDHVINVDDPGSLTKVGWRTAMDPNGTYEVTTTGLVGSLYSFAAQPLAITVRN